MMERDVKMGTEIYQLLFRDQTKWETRASKNSGPHDDVSVLSKRIFSGPSARQYFVTLPGPNLGGEVITAWKDSRNSDGVYLSFQVSLSGLQAGRSLVGTIYSLCVLRAPRQIPLVIYSSARSKLRGPTSKEQSPPSIDDDIVS